MLKMNIGMIIKMEQETHHHWGMWIVIWIIMFILGNVIREVFLR